MRVVGEGHAYPIDGKSRYRCRKWQLRVRVCDDGEWSTVSRTFPNAQERRSGIEGTVKDAKAALDAFMESIGDCGRDVSDGVTFAEYLDRWTEARRASGNYSERTVDAQAAVLANLAMHVGDMPLASIDATAVEDAYARIRAGESKSGRRLAGSTLALIHRSLTGMVHYAEAHGDVPEGLLKGLKAPKADTEEKRAMSDADAGALLSSLRSELSPYTVCAAFCLCCGLRRSEALAVSWEDLEGGCVDIRRALDEKAEPKTPKSRAGSRKVPVPAAMSSLLDEWAAKQRAGRVGPVCSVCGAYMKPSSMTVWWQRNAARFGAEGYTLHELRHTYLTMLARSGVHPRVMQDLAGHENPDVTMRIYSHVSDADKRAAVASVEALA